MREGSCGGRQKGRSCAGGGPCELGSGGGLSREQRLMHLSRVLPGSHLVGRMGGDKCELAGEEAAWGCGRTHAYGLL